MAGKPNRIIRIKYLGKCIEVPRNQAKTLLKYGLASGFGYEDGKVKEISLWLAPNERKRKS